MTEGPVTWQEFTAAAPELAIAAQSRLEAAEHHVLATIRFDGSPRLNGTNVVFDGADLLVGSMPGTRRSADLRRDPRCALHTAPDLPTLPDGDVRFDCVATDVGPDRTRAVFARLAAERTADGEGTGEPLTGDLFSLGLRSVSMVQVDGDELRITVWSPDEGLRVVRRS